MSGLLSPRLPIIVCAALGTFVPAPAEAAVQSDTVLSIAAGAGGVGGLAASIAAVVYAAQERTFDTPWVIVSLISSAICTSTALTLALNTDSGGGAVGTVVLSGFAIWPAYWTIRGATSGVPPGAPLDAPPYMEPMPPLSIPSLLPPVFDPATGRARF